MMTEKKYQKFIEDLAAKNLKTDELMSRHTTFKIGGPADLFYEAGTEAELSNVIDKALRHRIPYLILGRGSNLLVGDRGIRGLVIKCQMTQIKLVEDSQKTKIIAQAGAFLNEIINFAAQKSFGGLEFLVGIPATVGGAVRGNAGAWRQSIGEKIIRVKVLGENAKIKWLNQKDCQFSYRFSRFKGNKEIILEVELAVEKKEPQEIQNLINSYMEKRNKQPKESSAGCVFINPQPESAGKLIEECGLKGKKIGGAQISPLHANFIVNLGKARAKDVLDLLILAKKSVQEKFGISLEEEIVKIGEF